MFVGVLSWLKKRTLGRIWDCDLKQKKQARRSVIEFKFTKADLSAAETIWDGEDSRHGEKMDYFPKRNEARKRGSAFSLYCVAWWSPASEGLSRSNILRWLTGCVVCCWCWLLLLAADTTGLAVSKPRRCVGFWSFTCIRMDLLLAVDGDVGHGMASCAALYMYEPACSAVHCSECICPARRAKIFHPSQYSSSSIPALQ